MDAHASHAAEIDKHVRGYVVVFITLLTMTALTVMVSYLHLETHEAIAVALTIATFKASLVGLFFMHLISERQVIVLVLALTFTFALVLLALPILTNLDPIAIRPR